MSLVDTLPLLSAMLWYGFSLSFFVIVCIMWVDHRRHVALGDVNDPPRQTTHVSPALRWSIAILGLVGAFGGAGLGGLHGKVVGVSWSFLVGVVIGTALAIVLRKYIIASSHVVNGHHPDA